LWLIPVHQLVFIDECGIGKQDDYEYAWAPRGQKIRGNVAGKERGRVNVVAGLCDGKPLAFHEFHGSMNTKRFLQWLQTYLIPRIAHRGKIVVLDNASFHTAKRIKALLRLYGIGCWYLPKYSPDFNPIEHYWAWIKRKRREFTRDQADTDFNQRLASVKNLPCHTN
jgi:transposase